MGPGAGHRAHVHIKRPACAGCVQNQKGDSRLAGLPTLSICPGTRQGRDPEGTRLSLRTVAAPSVPKSHATSNTFCPITRRSRSTPFEPCRHEACGIDDDQLRAIRLSVCPADEKTHVTDQRRPRSVLLHAMLYPWSLLHISTDLTTTVVKMRSSPNVWRRMTASPINLR